MRLYEEMKATSKGEAAKKKTAQVNGWVSGSGEELRSAPYKIGGVHVEAVLDVGADQSALCPRLVEKLEAAGIAHRVFIALRPNISDTIYRSILSIRVTITIYNYIHG